MNLNYNISQSVHKKKDDILLLLYSPRIPPRPMALNITKLDDASENFLLNWSLLASTMENTIKGFEIHASVRKIDSCVICPWKKVCEIPYRCRKNGNFVMKTKIKGMTSGYNYQFLLRTIDAWNRVGAFSQLVTASL